MKKIDTIRTPQRTAGFLRIWPIALMAMTVFAFCAWTSVASAWDEWEETTFDVANIYFELNDTDGDLGIHALIDGDAWRYLKIEDTRGYKMLNIFVRGRLQRQGLTELFFESAEPTFDELTPKKFFRRFPEGWYEIEGITLEGEELESEVWLSHVMPAPPDVLINGFEEDVYDCDEAGGEIFPAGDPITISWEPVVSSHPGLGKDGPVTVRNYEVVVEIDETPWKTSAILSPELEVLAFVVPQEILALAEFEEGQAEIKFEVLVRDMNYNQTAVEGCFVIEEQ